MKAHPAQVTPETPESSQVSRYRALPKRWLDNHITALQNRFGREFDFDTLGEILSRATDDEIRALHRRKPRPW